MTMTRFAAAARGPLTAALCAALLACSEGSDTTGPPPSAERLLEMDAVTLQPGEELFWCQDWANPFEGADTDLVRFESSMADGGHHLIAFLAQDLYDGEGRPCGSLSFGPTAYGSTTREDSAEFGEGLAMRLSGRYGLRVQAHYLNSTSAAVSMSSRLNLVPAESASISAHVGILISAQSEIAVPPQTTQDVTKTCAIPFDMELTKVWSHMHPRSRRFTATIAGDPVYETEEWEHPDPRTFDPPRHASAFAELTHTCTIANDTASELTFGQSVLENEMCNFIAVFHPLPEGALDSPSMACE